MAYQVKGAQAEFRRLLDAILVAYEMLHIVFYLLKHTHSLLDTGITQSWYLDIIYERFDDIIVGTYQQI